MDNDQAGTVLWMDAWRAYIERTETQEITPEDREFLREMHISIGEQRETWLAI